MKIFYKKLVFVILLLSLLLSSCKTSLKVKAESDSSADINFSTQLGEVIYKTIVSLSSAAGNNITNPQIFSQKEIEEAVKGGDLNDCSVKVNSNDSVSITGIISAPAKQKMVSDEGGLKIANFINCGARNLTLIFSPSLIQTVVNTLPEDEKQLTEILMAPVLTGDEMSAEDYVDLISVIFGNATSEALSSAVFEITMIAPGNKVVTKTSLSDAKDVKTKGDSVSFTIPVVDLLTLSEVKTYSIAW